MLRPTLFLTLFVIAYMAALPAKAQDFPPIRIEKLLKEVPLPEYLASLESHEPVRFFFMESWLSSYTVGPEHEGRLLHEVLRELLADTDVEMLFLFDYAYIFTKDPAQAIRRRDLLYEAALQKNSIVTVTLGERSDFQSGKYAIVRGIVRDNATGSSISGVSISVDGGASGITDADGAYALNIPEGEHVVTFHYLNYDPYIIDLRLYRSGTANVRMKERPTLLEEVVVSDQMIINRKVGESTIKIEDIKRLPTFLGQADVIRQIQNQPGVVSTGEIAGGFNVRGGGIDQNLILFDGTPIINTTHALGLFSALNTEAISNASFYNGGIPAEYGGRASSVLAVTGKEGDSHKWNGNGSIGLISSQAAVGGPIKKDTTTFQATFRMSHANWLVRAVKSNFQDLSSGSLNFFDGTMKLRHSFSRRTRLQLFGYMSVDRFSLTNDTIFNARNGAASLRLDHELNDRWLATVTAGWGSYDYELEESSPLTAFSLTYGIRFPYLKVDVLDLEKKLSFGIHNTYYDFHPGNLEPTSGESNAAKIDIPGEKSIETAFYIGKEFAWNDRTTIEVGVRLSMFNRLGEGVVYGYKPNEPIEERNVVDSVHYGNGEIMQSYLTPEPRASIRYSLNPGSSLKVGYHRMAQYMHLVSNTAAATPVDIWQSCNTFFKPLISDQLSLGLYKTDPDGKYEMYGELFYKWMKNTLDYKDGANLVLNDKLETALIACRGQAYGLEVSFSKVRGRLIGAFNYTLSRSFRQTNEGFDSEKINNGKWFRANFDIPHVVNINWRYAISQRHYFSGTFSYHSGRPMSLPVATYTVDGAAISYFPERNTERIPDYHRLDIAFVIEGNHKRNKAVYGTWTLSLYNVYARKNAYSVFFQQDEDGKLIPQKLSIIGSIIPSLSYGFKF